MKTRALLAALATVAAAIAASSAGAAADPLAAVKTEAAQLRAERRRSRGREHASGRCRGRRRPDPRFRSAHDQGRSCEAPRGSPGSAGEARRGPGCAQGGRSRGARSECSGRRSTVDPAAAPPRARAGAGRGPRRGAGRARGSSRAAGELPERLAPSRRGERGRGSSCSLAAFLRTPYRRRRTTRDDEAVTRRTRLVAGAAGIAVLAFGGGAVAAEQIDSQGQLARYLFGPRLVRAEVIVNDRGTIRDLRVDRGRIVRVRPGAIVLRSRRRSACRSTPSTRR